MSNLLATSSARIKVPGIGILGDHPRIKDPHSVFEYSNIDFHAGLIRGLDSNLDSHKNLICPVMSKELVDSPASRAIYTTLSFLRSTVHDGRQE